jgi:hypothetical protein
MRSQFFRDHDVTYQGTENVNGTNTTLTATLRVNPNGTPCRIDLTIQPPPQGIPCNSGNLLNGVVSGSGTTGGNTCNFTGQTFDVTGTGICAFAPNLGINTGTAEVTGMSLNSTNFNVHVPAIPPQIPNPIDVPFPDFGIDCISVAVGTAN